MHEQVGGERQTRRRQECGPEDGVEAGDALADDMEPLTSKVALGRTGLPERPDRWRMARIDAVRTKSSAEAAPRQVGRRDEQGLCSDLVLLPANAGASRETRYGEGRFKLPIRYARFFGVPRRRSASLAEW